jgi:XTP/dITP diphosphohydrolase
MGNVEVADGCAVVLVDDRLGPVVPAAAVPLLRGAAAVYAEESLSRSARQALGAALPPPVGDLCAQASGAAVVLIAAELGSAETDALHAAGAPVITAAAPAGVELLDAVTVMDRLRSPGGCPWDAEQSHESLRRYLVEETYELLDAIARDDRGALVEELGDVLLQVLFHARIATEDASEPFGIDEVAAALVSKLVSRHPHVFADGETLHDAESQQLRWEELKQVEKQRESSVDGVATGQPALALAAKLAQRAERAGIPRDLLPHGESTGAALFAAAARARQAGEDPEDEVRIVALRFMARVRSAEDKARESGQEHVSPSQWRRFWPH